MTRTLVLNATGKVSALVISELEARGLPVVAASRQPGPSSTHVERVRFDYAEPSTFDAALDGVDRLFWVSPPMVHDSHALTAPFLERASKQVKKLVLMTAAGVETSDAIPMRRIELDVERRGPAFVHLRPTWFMDNFHTFWVGAIKHDGVIPLPAGDGSTAFIDARDIAASAVAALVRDDIANQAFTLTGPASLTYAQAAEVLGRAAGREIRYVPIDDAAFIEGGRAAGIDPVYGKMLTELFAVVRAGWSPAPTDAVQQLTGKPPRDLASYANDFASAWKR